MTSVVEAAGGASGSLSCLNPESGSLSPEHARWTCHCQTVKTPHPPEAKGPGRDHQRRGLNGGIQIPYSPCNLGNISLVLKLLLHFPPRHTPASPQTPPLDSLKAGSWGRGWGAVSTQVPTNPWEALGFCDLGRSPLQACGFRSIQVFLLAWRDTGG